MLSTLEHISEEIEEFVNMFTRKGQFSKEDIEKLKVLLHTVHLYLVDDPTALQVHKIGVTDSLLNIMLIFDQIDPPVMATVADLLSQICSFDLAFRAVQQEIDFTGNLIMYLQQIAESREKRKKYDSVTVHILQTLRYYCATDANVDVFVEKKGLEHLSTIFEDKEISYGSLVYCALLIDKVAYSDKIALQLVPQSMLQSIKAYYTRYGRDLEFLKAFSLLCGTITRSPQLQILMFDLKFY